MNDPVLVNFPLPMLTALLCCAIAVLVWRLDLGARRASVLFSALFGFCALEAFLVGLRFGYGVDALIPLQRALPLYLGPLMYLGFVALTTGAHAIARLCMLHFGAPVVILAVLMLAASDLHAIDWVITASYLYYATCLFRLWRRGPDALIYARIGFTRSLSNWILRSIGLLMFILLLDTAIALDFAFYNGAHVARLISFGTVPLILILLTILMTFPALISRPDTVTRPQPQASRQDAETEAKVRALLTQDQLFLDLDLTVQRLARRLHLPARHVSASINRTNAMNVSQYVNQFRLEHAADLLLDSDASVTRIAEQSGFLTRSNFYREFQRVYDQSPTEFRKSGRSAE